MGPYRTYARPVYCRNCRHCDRQGWTVRHCLEWKCLAPGNIVPSWSAPVIDKHPKDRNSNNDCDLYEPDPIPIPRPSFWRRIFRRRADA